MATKIWTGETNNTYATSTNWVNNSAPGSADDVFIQGSVNIDGADQSGTAIGSFTVLPGYTGTIGGLETVLQIDTNAFDFSGQGISYIDLGGSTPNGTTLNVRDTAIPGVSGQAGLYLDLLSSTGIVLNVTKGYVQTPRHGDTAKIATVNVGHETSPGSDAYGSLKTGLTIDTGINVLGGLVELGVNAGVVTVAGGALIHKAGTITTLNMRGGTAILKSTGTITTLNAQSGSVDYSQDGLSKTVTTLNAYGASIRLDPNAVTVTNAIGSLGAITFSR